MSERIVVLDGYTLNPGDIGWDAFAELGDLTVYDRSGPLIGERAADAPIVITNKDVLSADVIERLPKLRYIGVTATGTNIVDLQAATRRGIVVSNVPGYGAASVSQHTFALIFELTNRVGLHAQAVRGGDWASCPDFCFTVAPMTELDGKELGIVGVGAIGQRVARIAAALGMKILAGHQRSEKEVSIPGVAIEWLPLDDLFSRADVVTLHCPLTADTEHLVNRQRLALMKPGALLINTGRGPLVDEEALAEALRGDRLAGAALDVLSVEPPPAHHALIEEPRCIVTPHVAWATIEARRRLMQISADNLKAFLEGRPANVVNPAVLS